MIEQKYSTTIIRELVLQEEKNPKQEATTYLRNLYNDSQLNLKHRFE